jgi:hypothetical protein
MHTLNRREFLRALSLLGLGALAAACAPASTPTPGTEYTPVIPTPEPPTPAPLTETPAIAALAPTVTSQGRASPAPTSKPTMAPTATPPPPTPTPAEAAYLAVVRGGTPAALTERALAAIGGIERFVKRGYDVIVKPNICNANHGPEYASTTNPEVVATLVQLCLGAGA